MIGGILVVAFAIPATGYELYYASTLARPTAGNGNFIRPDERDALNYLAHNPTPGGVITKGYLGSTVPGITGRNTLLGDCLWSEPDCTGRSVVAQRLFDGTLDQAAVRTLLPAPMPGSCSPIARPGQRAPRARLAGRVRAAIRLRGGVRARGQSGGPRDPNY